MTDNNQKFANSAVRKMKAYSPPLDNRGAYSGVLLDFNERSIPVCSAVREALVDYAKNGDFHRYPEYFDLDEKIAEYVNFSEIGADEVMICNGSDQGIEVVFRTFTSAGDRVIIPGPSFTMFNQCAGVIGCEILTPQYSGENMDFPLEVVLSLLDGSPRLLVICNPNNPTGTLVSLENIEMILKAAPQTMVMVDEAYYEFSGVSAASLVETYPNLIVTRTFSKAFGLAAFRLGYVMSQKQNINEMLKVRGPYDVNMAARVSARAALENVDEIRTYVREVMDTAKPEFENFLREAGVKFIPSASNFLLVRMSGLCEVKEAYKKLDAAGFRVRPRKEKGLEDCLRISIGTVEQMREFMKTFEKLFLSQESTAN
jgi:histidinol-phosphate aminotransferase